jgi:hypothetical protein
VLDSDGYGGVWTSKSAWPLASGVPVACKRVTVMVLESNDGVRE